MHSRSSKILLGIAACLLATSCARRVELPPLPHDVQQTVVVISADKTLTAEQKKELIKEVIASTERIYTQVIQRQESQGANVKETALQLLAVAASVAALVWGIK